MKNTGIIRKTDALGRIVLPKVLRREIGATGEEAAFEIFLEGQTIVLRPRLSVCCLCGTTSDVTHYNDMGVCTQCRQGLSNQL